MKEILLTRGKIAKVSDEDFERVSAHKWHARKADKLWYAQTNIRENGEHHMLQMHRFILGVPSSVDVEHEDRDGLNNQRDNLRECTQSQNNANREKCCGGSQYKGIWARGSKWRAGIRVHGKTQQLGTFDTDIEAAQAYNDAAIEAWGEFARVNDIPGVPAGVNTCRLSGAHDFSGRGHDFATGG